jgi:putative ABC transport system permease protein
VIVEAVRQAMRLLWAHKLRAILTLFGLVWGTAAVIFLVGWGKGVTTMLETGFFRAGKNMGEVWPGRVSEQYTPAADRRYIWFDNDDLEALRRRTRLPEIIGGEAWALLPATYRQRSLTVDVRGVDPEAIAIRGVKTAEGRSISRSDVDHRRHVVVLGTRTRDRLLGAEGRVGSYIRLAGKPFKVIGVLERVGTQLSRDRMEIDDQVLAPISTVQSSWGKWWTEDAVVDKIIYRMRHRNMVEETEAEVRAVLSDRLGFDPTDEEAVGIWSSLKMLNTLPIDQTSGLMFVMAVTTLAIGGIGVMSMMLDSVQERRPEIGMRMAIGARRRDIVGQFFVETFAVTSLGGLLGAALGTLGCHLLGQVDTPDLIPVPELTLDIVVIALGVMTFVGLTAGLVPAWRAARVDPSETLRME